MCLYIDVLVNCHAENDTDRGEQFILELTVLRGHGGRVEGGMAENYGCAKSFEAVTVLKTSKTVNKLVAKAGMTTTDNTETVASVSVCLEGSGLWIFFSVKWKECD